MARLSEEARARLREAMRAKRADPSFAQSAHEAMRSRFEWTDDMIATARRMADAGASAMAIGAALGIKGATVSRHAARYGVDLGVADRRMEAGAAVLRQHYGTMMPTADLLALYREARGVGVDERVMAQHARRINLRRPGAFLAWNLHSPDSVVRARRRAQDAQRAAVLQAAVDAGESLHAACKARGICDKTAKRLRDAGMVKVPVRQREAATAGMVHEAARAERVRLAAEMQAAINAGMSLRQARIACGVSRARADRIVAEGMIRRPPKQYAPEKPRPPKPTYQTVEEWQAAGGKITRCPPAYAEVTTGGRVSAEDGRRFAHTRRMRRRGRRGTAGTPGRPSERRISSGGPHDGERLRRVPRVQGAEAAGERHRAGDDARPPF